MKPSYINIHTHRPTGCHTEPTSIGLHPWDITTDSALDFPPLPQGVQAIGEIGLDYCVNVDRGLQMELFREQLQIAQQLSLPVVIHCVKAFEPAIKELDRFKLKAVIFHGFGGSAEQMQTAATRGYYLSYGDRSFRSPKSIETLRATPNDRLFLETDDSEATIEEIYAKVTKIKNITIDELQQQIAENYARIFK